MELKSIEKSFEESMKDYHVKEKSKHWKKRFGLTKKLYNLKNLKNFRNNNLSDNLDDKHPFENQKKNFKRFKSEVPKKFYSKYLSKVNIGNNRFYFDHEGFTIDSNEIFIIKWLYDIRKFIFLKKNNIYCEIGAGYGALASKILKNRKSKYIIIDLPEALFLSAYFLKENFKNKKICLYSDLKSKTIDSNLIERYDIFLIPPWVKLSDNLKIDFFINTRSFSEMNSEIIGKYFELIQKHINKNGFFLNINRYEKSTVGQSIKFYKFPYDFHWEKLISKKSWNQDNIHFLLTKRVEKAKIDLYFVKVKTLFIFLNISFKKKLGKFKRTILQLID
jgi:putative sugar O-methyltransferase